MMPKLEMVKARVLPISNPKTEYNDIKIDKIDKMNSSI
jgi:hypothetical protein